MNQRHHTGRHYLRSPAMAALWNRQMRKTSVLINLTNLSSSFATTASMTVGTVSARSSGIFLYCTLPSTESIFERFNSVPIDIFSFVSNATNLSSSFATTASMTVGTVSH